MDQEHKDIYNTYLRVYGQSQNRGFKYKKNFDDMGDDKKAILDRLAVFFGRYPHINVDTFFEAPYKLWGDTMHFPLDFYTKRKALSCYVNYKKQIVLSDPDTTTQIERVVSSLKFIRKYCIRENIKVDDYIKYKKGNYVFLEHLKNDEVSIYLLFAYDEFRDIFSSVDNELKNALFGDLYSTWDNMNRKYNFSTNCKVLAKKGLQKIK